MQLNPTLLTSTQIQQPCIQVNNQNIKFIFFLQTFLCKILDRLRKTFLKLS